MRCDAEMTWNPTSASTRPAVSFDDAGTAATAPPQRFSLKQVAIRGSMWMICGHGAQQVLRLGSNLLLTRLLFPEVFGLMALVSVFMRGLAMFSDIGIRPAIVQSKRGNDPGFLNTAWTLQILRGFSLWLGTCALAWPAAAFYGEPTLMRVLPVAGLAALIAGFTPTKLPVASRHLLFGRLAFIELTAQAVGILGTVALALLMRSIWALVLGSLIPALVRIAVSHLALAGPVNHLQWEKESSRELLRFGRWILVSTLLTFCAMQTDRMMLGKLVTLDVLGVYSIAFGFILAGKQLFERLTSSVLLPALAGIGRRRPDDFRGAFVAGRGALLSGGALGCAGAVLFAPLFFETLYDPRYHDAGWMAQLLAVGLWFWLLESTSTAGLLARGHTVPLAGANTANLLITVIAAPLGFYYAGVSGFILGWGLGNLAGLVVIQMSLWRLEGALAGQDLAFTAMLGGLVGAGLCLQWSTQGWPTTDAARWMIEGLSSAAVLGSGAAVALLWMRNARPALESQVSSE